MKNILIVIVVILHLLVLLFGHNVIDFFSNYSSIDNLFIKEMLYLLILIIWSGIILVVSIFHKKELKFKIDKIFLFVLLYIILILPLIGAFKSVQSVAIVKEKRVSHKEARLLTENQVRDIVYAIDNYRKDNGSYPNTLKDLTPLYIRNIPYPLICGEDAFFEYTTTIDNSYLIKWNETIFGSDSYSPKYGLVWQD